MCICAYVLIATTDVNKQYRDNLNKKHKIMTMNGSTETNNRTFVNLTSERKVVYQTASLIISLAVFLIGIVVFLSDSLMCLTMMRTKRVPFATRFLTCTTLVCDAVYVLIFLIGYIVLQPGVEVTAVVVSVATETARLCMGVSYVCIALMAVERAFCLNFGHFYSTHFNNELAYKVLMFIVGAFLAFKLTLRYAILPLATNNNFDFVENSGDLKINLSTLAVCLLISIACYVNIYVIIRRHTRQMKTVHVRGNANGVRLVSRSYYSTRAARVIFVFFIVLHLPLLLILSVRHSQTKDNISRFLVLACMIITCGLNPFVYAWRFKECRFIIKSFISVRFGIFTNSVASMRVDIYNIVLNEGPSRATRSEGSTMATDNSIGTNISMAKY